MKKRIWKYNDDNGAVHAIGNGEILAYEIGPQIIQIICYPYSAPSFAELTVDNLEYAVSERLEKTNVWKHQLDNGSIISDYADANGRSFIRNISALSDYSMTLKISKEFLLTGKDEFSFETLKGCEYYGHAAPKNAHACFKVIGNIEINKINDLAFSLKIHQGNSYIIFGEKIEDLPVTEKDCQKIFSETILYWNNSLSRLKAVPKRISEICESVAVMIKAQQGKDGGIMAGYAYHLAYIRDQYGTVRGLLSLGLLDEAKAVMYYYKSVFDEYGELHTAQSIGVHGVFHIHENDCSEITGYIVVMTFDIYEICKDDKFLNDMLPMVKWALECQKKLLLDNMLPFNGDETYIAGGFLPRYAIYDGSAEATMLFAEGIKRYMFYTGDKTYKDVYNTIKDSYESNFIIDGRFITNNPNRLSLKDYPATRHGICECCACVLEQTYITESGRYVCRNCMDRDMPPRDKYIFELAASKLSIPFMNSDLISEEKVVSLLTKMVNEYNKTGKLPSGCPENEAVGYDYGLLLYALTKYGFKEAKNLFETALDVLDETDVWCEYYRNGIAYRTRCRPWESGINITAIINFANAKCEYDKKNSFKE